MLLLFQIAVALLLSLSHAQAADIYASSDGHCNVQIVGTINPGDDKKFYQLIWQLDEDHNCKVQRVELISEGGDLEAALKIGWQIRALHASTQAPDDHGDGLPPWCEISKSGSERKYSANTQCMCASACVFIWSAGRFRTGNALDIHRPYFDRERYRHLSGDDAHAKYTELLDKSRAYLVHMNVPAAIIDRLFSINSSKTERLSPRERAQMTYAPYYEELMIATCGKIPEPGEPGLRGKLMTHAKCNFELDETIARKSFWPWLSLFRDVYGRPR